MKNTSKKALLSFILVLSIAVSAFAVMTLGASAEDTACGGHVFGYNADYTAEATSNGVSYKCKKCGEAVRTAELDSAAVIAHKGVMTLNARSVDLIEGENFQSGVLSPKDGGNMWITFGVTPTDLSGFSSGEGGYTLLKLQIGNVHRIMLRGYKVDGETVRFTAQNSAGKTVELSGTPILKTGNSYKFVIEVEPDTGKYYIYLNGEYLGGNGFKLNYGASEDYKLLFGGSGNFELSDFTVFNPTKISESGKVIEEGVEQVKEALFEVKCTECGKSVYTAPGIDYHSDKNRGVSFVNGAIEVSHASRHTYNLPAALIGPDKDPYMMSFKLTLNRSASEAAVSNIYNNGNGRNFLRYDYSYNSLLRQYPVPDGNGGYKFGVVDIKSKIADGVEMPVTQLKVGDSVKLGLYVIPEANAVHIYVDGEYVGTRTGGSPAAANSEWIGIGDPESAMGFTLSEMSIVAPDRARTAEGKTAEGASVSSLEYYTFNCSCGYEVGVVDEPADTDVGGADTDEGEEEMQGNGLDSIIGIRDIEYRTLISTEDTYVCAGTNSKVNYSGESTLLVKGTNKTPDRYFRVALIKFDISSLYDFDVETVSLELNCVNMEDSTVPTTVHIYSCFADDWDEKTVTYENVPKKDLLIDSIVFASKGMLRINVTDYIKECLHFGDKEVAFYLEGDGETPYGINFSTNASAQTAPKLIVSDGTSAFSTKLDYAGENPWELAMRYVSTWFNRWAAIKAEGDFDSYMVQKDDSEYSLTVDVATTARTDGYNTKYSAAPTRNVSTLKGYTEDYSETAKLDIYGGLMDESLRQEATGFFYTVKIDGRWWTIDPLGYPFFRTALNNVRIGSAQQTKLKARVLAQYGTEEAWAEMITDKLKNLGFNSVGSWSAYQTHMKLEEPLTQTAMLYVLKKYAGETKVDVTTGGNTAFLNDVMPVFDPAFVASADITVSSQVSAYANNPFVYGWMSDNELPRSLKMLDNYLILDHTDTRFIYSYATAWTFMFMKTGKADVSLDDVTDDLRKEFRAMIYDRYFEVVRGALDRYAPYHQYVGCRFFAGSLDDESIMRVAGRWCDVISYNYYHNWTPNFELLYNQIKWAGKPVIITEWYVRGMDIWEKDNRIETTTGAGMNVRTQEDRGKFYQNFALALMESKNCVGFDWFYMQDTSPDDTQVSNGGNKGILDGDGNEYTDFTKYIRELNNQKYNLIKFFDERG